MTLANSEKQLCQLRSVLLNAKLASNGTFTMAESIVGQQALNPAITITISSSSAEHVATQINGVGFTNIQASVDSNNRVVIEHTKGGEIAIVDANNVFASMGFTVSTPNLYADVVGFRASNWKILSYTASNTAVTTTAADGQLWYSSVVDEVDIIGSVARSRPGETTVSGQEHPSSKIDIRCPPVKLINKLHR